MEGSAVGYRSPKNFSDTRKVFGMYRIARSPVLHLLKRSAEIIDDLAIEGIKLAVGRHDRNETVYPVDRRAQTSLAVTQRLFGALTLDKLTDLAADGRQHVEQLPVGLPDLATEKLDHAQNFAPEQNGKAEGRVQPFAFGDRAARKVLVRNDIGNVFGLEAGPHSARQSQARDARDLPGDSFKLGDFDRRVMPKLDTA